MRRSTARLSIPSLLFIPVLFIPASFIPASFIPGITLSPASFPGYPTELKPPPFHTIILDPGHGGIDPGTINGLFSREKDVTLKIALKLGKSIQKEFPGVKVVYTRTTDVLPGNAATRNEGLYNRAKIANEARGDLFISIHCDATVKPAGGYYEKEIIGYKRKKKAGKWVTSPVYKSYWIENTTTGATTYIWRADKSGEKVNAIDQRGGDTEDIDDSAGIWDTRSAEAIIKAELYEKKYFFKSDLFASFVEEEFQKAGRKTWGVRQRGEGIHVLEATGMPSVLIETGYLSNREEEKYLNSNKGQNQVVQNIINALRRYKKQLEAGKTNIKGPEAL
jgi:N-acetylmuramoyl-L-alanine amidase